MAQNLPDPVFAVSHIKYGLHIAEYLFADFTLHVSCTFQNRSSTILACVLINCKVYIFFIITKVKTVQGTIKAVKKEKNNYYLFITY